MLQQQPMWIKSLWVLLLTAPLLIYGSTVLSMQAIWESSETFVHGYFILPISLWLIWQQRESLLRLNTRPCWWALPFLLGAGFAWLLAELAEVQVVAQYAFVLLWAFLVWLVLGSEITNRIKFPLAFLLLAVPFGEVLVPALIEFTADFTVAAIQLTGIPVVRDGVRFSTPTGHWVVVEECSGLRYLIASFTLGSLYAYLTYRTWWRQGLCILLSIIVPIIANGLRAFMIVMIGHFSGMKLAVGVDHLIYGWLFFGVVMLLFFWIGSFWREDDVAAEAAQVSVSTQTVVPVSQLLTASGIGLCCLLLWPLYGHYLQQKNAAAGVVQLAALPNASEGSVEAVTAWQPAFLTPKASVQQVFQYQGQPVVFANYYYRQQNSTSKLISASNLLIADPTGEWYVKQKQVLTEGGLPLLESHLKGHGQALLVWQSYWIDGQFVQNNYLGKLLQARSMLLHQQDDGARLLLFTPINGDPAAARQILAGFLQQNLAAIEQQLQQAREAR